MPYPSDSTASSMLRLCSRHFDHLCDSGCDVETAADRTWDAYECAYMGTPAHCYDPRDRPFEDELRELARKDSNQKGTER